MPQRTRIGLYSESDEIGGAERSMLHLLHGPLDGEELVVCSTSSRLLGEAARVAPAVEQVLVPSARTSLGSVASHRRTFEALGLDVLQVTLGNPFRARSAMLAGFALRIPTVAVEQLVLPARRRRGRVLKRILSAPLAAHVVVGRRSAHDLHRWYGIASNEIEIIHNGVPDETVMPIRFERRPVVGCAARLEDQKALHLLVDAVAMLPEVRLVLVGEGSCRRSLEQRATANGLAGRFEITGWLNDARPAIAGFDIFALPSRFESFPLCIVEAMLAETAVVAADVGSVTDAVIDGETGLLVRSGDVSALAKAIGRLVADLPMRERLTRNARTLAKQQFTVTPMVESYRRMWARVSAGDTVRSERGA